MGTASTKKFLKHDGAGGSQEEAALLTSAGAADANRVPALNAVGVLDATILNGKTTSAGAGDSGKTPILDASGKLDQSFMPTGIGADTAAITASEALAAGDLVNVYNNGGTANVRKADAASNKPAHGFVLAGVASAASATVYFEGTNTQQTGLTPGVQYLSHSTPGKSTTTVPTTAGHIVQQVGLATSATSFNFEAGSYITLG